MGNKNDPKINVALINPTEQQMYRDLKGLAAIHGMDIRDVVIPALTEAVARLRKRTLPLGKTITLAKKKGE